MKMGILQSRLHVPRDFSPQSRDASSFPFVFFFRFSFCQICIYIYIYLFIIFHIFPSFHPVRYIYICIYIYVYIYICIYIYVYIYIHPMSSTSPHNSNIFGDSIVRRNLSLVASLVASQLLLARTADGRECMAGADLRWVFEVCQKFGNWNFETFFWCYPVTQWHVFFFLTQIGFWPTAMRIFTTKPGV